MANTYLTRTFASAGSATKFTLSAWIKRSGISTQQTIMSRYVTANKYVKILINNANQLEYGVYNNNAGGYQARYETSALFRDISAWYHIVVAQDSSLGTAADRVKFYINGNLVTSFATNTQIGQNIGGDFNNATAHQIGAYNGADFFDGLISHFHFCDNQQYAASTFGSVDSTTGEWKINPSPSVSYGTSGFLILKDGNTITDQSTNSNNWSLASGTLTKTEDSPSNVFATLNPLNVNPANTNTFANGNLKATLNGEGTTSTMAMSSGSYYMEYKCTGNITQWTGVEEINSLISLQYSAANKSVALYIGSGTMYVNGSNQGSGGYGGGWSSGDIGMIAFDADNARVYFGKNGSWWNGSSFGASSPSTYITTTTGKTYYFRFVKGGNTNTVYEVNFGNGYFGTTAVSSAGTNASGIGIFEFDVPAGFTALSTKGLNL